MVHYTTTIVMFSVLGANVCIYWVKELNSSICAKKGLL